MLRLIRPAFLPAGDEHILLRFDLPVTEAMYSQTLICLVIDPVLKVVESILANALKTFLQFDLIGGSHWLTPRLLRVQICEALFDFVNVNGHRGFQVIVICVVLFPSKIVPQPKNIILGFIFLL
jgi:hypothetical protein